MLSRFLFFQSRVLSYCSYTYIYTRVYLCIPNYLFAPHTHTSDFHASSFPRNWREIVEHQAFPRNQNVPQFEVDASSCVTQRGLEPSVLFSFPFSFLFFFYIHLSFSFYNAKNRDLALSTSISIVSLFCQELKSWKGRVKKYFHVRTTLFIPIHRGNRSVASRTHSHSLRTNCDVTLSWNNLF